jgi:hypothetical protein
MDLLKNPDFESIDEQNSREHTSYIDGKCRALPCVGLRPASIRSIVVGLTIILTGIWNSVLSYLSTILETEYLIIKAGA